MNYIRMNKVLRNMAIDISSKSNNLKVLVIIHEEQQQPPKEVEWPQDVKRISLMNSEFCHLPEEPKCKNLSTLFLQKNDSLVVIPESLFKLMENLRVLDLHATRNCNITIINI